MSSIASSLHQGPQGSGPGVKVQDGWLVYTVLCLFLDNSDSPSIVEQ